MLVIDQFIVPRNLMGERQVVAHQAANEATDRPYALRVWGFRMLAVKNSKTRFAVEASGANSAGMPIPAIVWDRCFGGLIPPTKAAAKLMVFDYIETFYNRRRRHSALDYRSPLQFEEDFICSLGEGCSGGGGQAARPASKNRSALAALVVNNSPELFKPPETTRSNHLNTLNSTPNY